MSTERKKQASRRNGGRSRGPKTPKGKAAAARNALKHGLCARATLVLPDEDPQAYAVLAKGIRDARKPVGAMEELLVKQIVDCSWRLQRGPRVEVGLYERRYYEAELDKAHREIDRLARNESELEARVRRALLHMPKLNADREVEDPVALGFAVIHAAAMRDRLDSDAVELGHAFVAEMAAFEKLTRYEAGLQRELYRASHELERLQRLRAGEAIPAPQSVDVTLEVGPRGDQTEGVGGGGDPHAANGIGAEPEAAHEEVQSAESVGYTAVRSGRREPDPYGDRRFTRLVQRGVAKMLAASKASSRGQREDLGSETTPSEDKSLAPNTDTPLSRGQLVGDAMETRGEHSEAPQSPTPIAVPGPIGRAIVTSIRDAAAGGTGTAEPGAEPSAPGVAEPRRRPAAPAVADDTVCDKPLSPAEQAIAVARSDDGGRKRRLGPLEEAIAACTAVIEKPDAPADHRAATFLKRARLHRDQGQFDQAVADCGAVIDMADAPAARRVDARINRAIVHGQQDHLDQAVGDATAAIENPNATPDQRAEALRNRAIFRRRQGDLEQAIADNTTVINMPDVDAVQRAKALINRSVIHGQQRLFDEAISGYTEVLEKMRNVPAAQRTAALFKRAEAYQTLGRRQNAIADYTAFIDSPGLAAALQAKARYRRGVIYAELGNMDRAVADFRAVNNMAGAPAAERERASAAMASATAGRDGAPEDSAARRYDRIVRFRK